MVCFLDEIFEEAMMSVKNGDNEAVRKVSDGRYEMRKTQKKLSKSHLSRVKSKDCDAALTPDYSEILHSLDRIADNCIGITEEAMDNISFVNLKSEAQYDAENISGGVQCITV